VHYRPISNYNMRLTRLFYKQRNTSQTEVFSVNVSHIAFPRILCTRSVAVTSTLTCYVTRRPLTAEARVGIRVGLVVDKVALGQVLLQVLRFFPDDIIPPSLSTLMYYRGINHRPASGRISETSSHHIDMNNNNNNKLYEH
jgi:hypothetical protein